MWCFGHTHDMEVQKVVCKCRLYFPKCLKQHKNQCIVVVTVQSYKEILIISEGPGEEAASRKITTERLRGGAWFHI